jgi:hypothetical protein
MKGWFYESQRHSLAARGYSTFSKKNVDLNYIKYYSNVERRYPGKQAVIEGIPIKADKLEEGRLYPLTPEDVKKVLGRMSSDDLKGIKEIEFVNPKGEQKDAWGQYVRSKKKVLIFSQPAVDGKLDGCDPDTVKKHIELYVLPHEVGHHIALNQRHITDKDIRVAEARADANVAGLDVQDKAVKSIRVQ